MFCNPVSPEDVLHIGRTGNAKTGLTHAHRRLPCIKRNGGLFVCVSWSRTPYTDYKDLMEAQCVPMCDVM